MKRNPDELLNSNYDGIEEYDNDLPKWWIALFLLTIVFGVVYSAYFVFGPGLSSNERLKLELAQIHKLQQNLPVAAQSSADDLLMFAKDSEILAKGRTIFAEKCAACHASLGEGLVGPNLTDRYWLHGGKITDIRKVIEEGVLDKGMLPWKGLLSKDEIDQVTAFVFSIIDSNPPNPKAPQGELVTE